MNESREKFTPGSWTVDAAEDAFGNLTIRLADGTEHGDTEADPIAMIYDYANARLIAAAPEMLEALVALCDAWWKGERIDLPEAIDIGRAAIARARGTDE